MLPLLVLGDYVFETLPLSLQTISETTKYKWPAKARFGTTAARQFVGYGDDEFTIEGLYYDAEFGGHGDYLALKALARQAQPIELIGWAAGGVAAQVFGLVVILEVSAKHAHITSAGVGAKVEFSVKCAPFGDDGPAGGLY